MAQVYCHCTDCRGWLNAPVHGATMWRQEQVSIVRGADNLIDYRRTENSHRKSCKSCGGAVLIDHPGYGLTDVPVSGIENFRFEPTMHLYYSERIIPMKDGLPKFAKMPKEFGGSGELSAE